MFRSGSVREMFHLKFEQNQALEFNVSNFSFRSFLEQYLFDNPPIYLLRDLSLTRLIHIDLEKILKY